MLPRVARIADTVAVLLLAAALVPAVFHGGVHIHVAGLRALSLTSIGRPLLAAALVIVARHAAWPRENLWKRLIGAVGLDWYAWPPAPRAARQMCVSGLALLLLFLAARATPVVTGDGGEYGTLALRFGRLQQPAASIDELRGRTAGVPTFGYSVTVENTIEGAGGRRDVVHFWLYSLLAAPFVRVATALGIHPNYGFLALNLLCLLVAAYALVFRVGVWSTVLLTTGPLVWWIDKAHPEIFVFSTLAVALALLRSTPAVSMLVLGALVAQVPAMAPVASLAFVYAAARGGIRAPRFWVGAAGGLAIASLHPLYYWLRLGILSPMTHVVARQVPTWPVLTAVLRDPNIGLLPNHPALTLVTAAALATLLVRASRRLVDGEVLLAACAAAAALFAFSQTTNFNHGATVSMSRYAVWIIPLAIPLLAQLHETTVPGKAVWLPGVAALSVGWAIAVYAPARPDGYLAPTRLAAYLWTHAAGVDNPLPEIFCERTEHSEGHTLPAATGGCEKLLVAGDGTGVTWPARCPAVTPPPRECQTKSALCYANRTRDGYAFVPTPWQPGFDWTRSRTAESDGR